MGSASAEPFRQATAMAANMPIRVIVVSSFWFLLRKA
jgi:hypothetical protein